MQSAGEPLCDVGGGVGACRGCWGLLRGLEVLFCPAILLASLDPAMHRTGNGNLGGSLE